MSITSQARASNTNIVMAHIFPSFCIGGQQSRFAALAGALGTDYEHIVVSLDGDFNARALIPSPVNISYREMKQNKSILSGVINHARFQKFFREFIPDILCTYNWGAMEAVFSNYFGKRLPHIHFEDGFGPDEADGNLLRRRVYVRRWLLSKSHIVVPSWGLVDIAIAKWRTKSSRLHHIQNGIEFSRFQRTSTGLHAKLVIGSIGALRPEKNYQRLISAFRQADRDGKAVLRIIGDGPEREHLLQIMKEARCGSRISLPGATLAPEDTLSDFDIFALSSDTEQAPLTLMEAMAVGLPIVATNVGDIADMVSEENRVFVTRCGDDAAYVEALSHLLQNPDARAALGAANRKKAKAEFSLAPMVDKYRELFSTVQREHNHHP